MSMHERFFAALGSVALNVAVGLVLTQSASAAVPAMSERQAEPQHQVIQVSAKVHGADKHCAMRLRNRAITAVLLALMV
jgi:hypothetical protein